MSVKRISKDSLKGDATPLNRFGSAKILSSNEELSAKVEAMRSLTPTTKIVLVLGTYDLLHIGHARYLELCSRQGDILVVLVDPDVAVKLSKSSSENRPVVPEDERIELIAHLSCVDYVLQIQPGDFSETTGLWLRKPPFKPDVLVVSERHPSDEEHIKACEAVAELVVVLPSQAETSTTAKIRKLIIDSYSQVRGKFFELLNQLDEAFGVNPSGK